MAEPTVIGQVTVVADAEVIKAADVEQAGPEGDET
jgi:hypothetical protein